MKSDADIKRDVEAELRFRPDIDERDIASVTNSISIESGATPSEIKRRIEEAFRRSAQIDADRITVDARAGEVTLRGNVRSWSERNEAQRTAWSAAGVTRVNNEITIGFA